jgi:imidazolonepropionase-like amidohydrolase
MSDISTFGFHEAARRLGVPLRILRRAIRAGHLPAPAQLTATAPLSDEWFDRAAAAAAEMPTALNRGNTQKVPPFARYEGTSAWRKYTNRVREYAAFRAALNQD